jgi:anti-anti-sigma regulatory factor
MEMDVKFVQGKVQVTILSPHGAVDGSNYQSVIAKAKELYEMGTRYLLLDLGDVNFLSSAGLVALHHMILLLRGEKLSETDSGWDALHAIDRDLSSGKQSCLKVLNPQPRVARTLEVSGMENFFDIFIDQQAAIDAFN